MSSKEEWGEFSISKGFFKIQDKFPGISSESFNLLSKEGKLLFKNIYFLDLDSEDFNDNQFLFQNEENESSFLLSFF